MSKLYELSGELIELENAIGSNEISIEDARDTIEALSMQFDQKAVNVVKAIENFKPDIDAIDQQISRLQARKKSYTNKMDSLRDYLRENMQRLDIKKIECPFFSITLKSPSPAVHIVDESKIPDEYMNIKTVITPNKKAILSALKDGAEIDGAEIKKSKPALQIK